MKNYEHPYWGDIYDLLHSGETADVDFYLLEARRAKGPVLDVACGTGRILLRMLQQRTDVWGIDISGPMLDRLEEKARRLGLQPRVIRADMRDFSLPQRFALIVVPFRSFLHLETEQDQLAALSCFRKHLSPNGRLVLNFPGPGPSAAEGLAANDRELRFGWELVDPNSGRRMKAWQSVSDDPSGRRQVIEWQLHELDESGQVVETRSLSLSLRWLSKAEFEFLLKAAGYSSWRVYGGFHGEPLEGENQEMVWIVER